MDAIDVINSMIAVEKAKSIRSYCRQHKECKTCVFYCGVCSLGTFHPSEWDFRELNYLGDGNESNEKF